jgi:glutathione peroxidase
MVRIIYVIGVKIMSKYLNRFCVIITGFFLGTASMANAKTAYLFEFDSIDGGKISLSEYKGDVILVVNTASECGFTRQYTGLQTLWDEFKDEGLVVLGIPSNDFGGQESGSDSQIKTFCEVNFDIDFPMAAKTTVKGRNAHPFYHWISEELGWMAGPKWNFHKYLIARNGTLHESFSSMVSPTSTSLQEKITFLLEQSG